MTVVVVAKQDILDKIVRLQMHVQQDLVEMHAKMEVQLQEQQEIANVHVLQDTLVIIVRQLTNVQVGLEATPV